MSNINLGNTIPRNGLVGEWLLDGNSLDTSGNAYNGTATNITYSKTYKGYVVQSASLGGTNSSVSIANNTNLQLLGNYTYGGWFNSTTNNSIQRMINKDRAADFTGGYCLMINNNAGYKYYLGHIGGGAERGGFTTVPVKANGERHHYIVRYDGATLKLYIDAVEVYSKAVTTNLSGDATAPLILGAYGSSPTGQWYNGKEELIRVYNIALSTDEIQLLYLEGLKKLGPANLGGFPNLLSNLVYYADFIGTAHNLVDGVVGTVSGATLTNDRFGYSNNAYSFDGVNDYIDYGNNYNVVGDITIDIWIYATKNTNYEGIVSKSASTTTNVPYEFRFSGNTGTYSLTFLRASTSDYWYWASGNLSSLLANKWAHVVVTNTGSNCKLYVNGVEQTMTLNRTVGTPSSNSTSMKVGTVTTLYFGGNVGECKIYNKALSATEVVNLYKLTSSDYIYPSPSYDIASLIEGLVLDLNEQGKDLSGNGNNATLTGSPTIIRQGKSKGLTYSGTGQYGLLSTTSFTNNQDLSVFAWVKVTSNPAGQSVILNCATDNQSLCKLYYITSAGVQYIKLSQTDDGSYTASHTVNLAGTGWHRIGMTKSGTTQKIYLDGVFVGTSGNSGTALQSLYNQGISIARNNYDATQLFNGSILRPKVWNKVLSDREIQADYYSQKGNFIY